MTFARRSCRLVLLLLPLAGLLAVPAGAQRTQTLPPRGQSGSAPASGIGQINDEITEMLGYWQLGDVDHLHQYFADEVTFLSSLYDSPLRGWTNYAAAYKSQFSQLSNVRLNRRNTYVKIEGNIAWAGYEWDLQAAANGEDTAARGQTTLIFEQRGNRWVIVHDHTSEVCPPQRQGREPERIPVPPAPVSPGM